LALGATIFDVTPSFDSRKKFGLNCPQTSSLG
jgi:hypothetical protein